MLLTNSEDSSYKIVISETVLMLRKVQLTQHKFIKIQKTLERLPAICPIHRIDLRTHSVLSGLSY